MFMDVMDVMDVMDAFDNVKKEQIALGLLRVVSRRKLLIE